MKILSTSEINNYSSFKADMKDVKQGRFYHFHRTYLLQEHQKILKISLNIFERIAKFFTELFGFNYFYENTKMYTKEMHAESEKKNDLDPSPNLDPSPSIQTNSKENPVSDLNEARILQIISFGIPSNPNVKLENVKQHCQLILKVLNPGFEMGMSLRLVSVKIISDAAKLEKLRFNKHDLIRAARYLLVTDQASLICIASNHVDVYIEFDLSKQEMEIEKSTSKIVKKQDLLV